MTPYVFTGDCASSYDALVPVTAQILARHGPAAYEIRQDACGVLTTLPRFAVDEAYLAAFRRVNPVHPYSLTSDLQGITVDDPGGAGDIG